MNESERRRRQLLEETRSRYDERNMPPAIHPRYKAAYASIYGRKSGSRSSGGSTFFVRLFLAFLLFALYLMIDYQDLEVANLKSEEIVQEIRRELPIESLLKY